MEDDGAVVAVLVLLAYAHFRHMGHVLRTHDQLSHCESLLGRASDPRVLRASDVVAQFPDEHVADAVREHCGAPRRRVTSFTVRAADGSRHAVACDGERVALLRL